MPSLKKPKSPPFAPEPGSSEFTLANSSNFAPALISFFRLSAFALAFDMSPFIAFTKMCLAFTESGTILIFDNLATLYVLPSK